MIFPTTDVGSDVRLGVRLYMNGHPRWAMSVLAPVFVNTIFIAVSCRKLEKSKANRFWILYLPLVLLQVYPQFCILRLIIQYLFRKNMSLENFVSNRDSLDGGIGCLEPYIESIPQVYIQTGIFAFVYNINPLLTRLCYTEKKRSCGVFDHCDHLYDCDFDPYGSGYDRYNNTKDLQKGQNNCTNEFETCIAPFRNCIDMCKNALNIKILELNESELFEYVTIDNETQAHQLNSTLVEQYDTTLPDLKLIQMHRLIIENYELFISTYILSILAAVYGVSKFFLLGHSRIVSSIMSKEFGFLCTANTLFMLLKGLVLFSVVMGHHRTMLENTALWLSFTMMPSMIIMSIATLFLPCKKLYQQVGSPNIGAIIDIISKQPSLILAPLITPFVFTLNEIHICDLQPIKLIKGKRMKSLCCIGRYSYSEKFTFINTICCTISTISLLCWKGEWISNTLEAIFIVCSAMLMLRLGIFWFRKIGGLKSIFTCTKHRKLDCLECIRRYGLFIEHFKYYEACEEHDDKKPFESKIQVPDCEKCQSITLR